MNEQHIFKRGEERERQKTHWPGEGVHTAMYWLQHAELEQVERVGYLGGEEVKLEDIH